VPKVFGAELGTGQLQELARVDLHLECGGAGHLGFGRLGPSAEARTGCGSGGCESAGGGGAGHPQRVGLGPLRPLAKGGSIHYGRDAQARVEWLKNHVVALHGGPLPDCVHPLQILL